MNQSSDYKGGDRPEHRTPLLELSEEELWKSQQLAEIRQRARYRANPELAAVLSLAVPGGGQFYLGSWGAGVVYLGISVLMWRMVLPWVLLALIGSVSAYRQARELNGSQR